MKTFRKGKRKLKTRIKKKGGSFATQWARKHGLYNGMSTSKIAEEIKAIDNYYPNEKLDVNNQKKADIEALLYEYSEEPKFESLYNNIIRDVKSKNCSVSAQTYVKNFNVKKYKSEMEEKALTPEQRLANQKVIEANLKMWNDRNPS